MAENAQDQLMDIMEEVTVEKVFQFFLYTDQDVQDWNLKSADWVNLNFPIGPSGGT